MRFFSQTYGFLVRFFWGHMSAPDLLAKTFRVPHGDFALPYFDFDQGRILLIAEYKNFGSPALVVLRYAAERRTRRRNNSKLPRPYIEPLICLSLLTNPSAIPLL